MKKFSTDPRDEVIDLTVMKRIWLLIKSLVFLEGNIRRELTDEEAEELMGSKRETGPGVDRNE